MRLEIAEFIGEDQPCVAGVEAGKARLALPGHRQDGFAKGAAIGPGQRTLAGDREDRFEHARP